MMPPLSTRPLGAPTEPRFVLGFDVGRQADYSAITVTEEVQVPTGEREEEVRRRSLPLDFTSRERRAFAIEREVRERVERRYHVRHIERPDLGTPYPRQVARVVEIVNSPPLKGRVTVAVDATGVGRAIVDMLQHARVPNLFSVTITGGLAVTRPAPREFGVPKRDLVSTLLMLAQSDRLHIAEGLDLGPVLKRELQAFTSKVNALTGHEAFEAWRERDHDDVVLSLAVGAWVAENVRPAAPRIRSLAS